MRCIYDTGPIPGRGDGVAIRPAGAANCARRNTRRNVKVPGFVCVYGTGDGRVVAVIATVDVLKRDAEVKLLIACTEDECRLALATHRQESQDALLIVRPIR